MDHQMNMQLSEAFGLYYVRIPLRASAHIHHANALKLDWETVVPPEQLAYILGNPPFVGSKFQSNEQRSEMATIFQGVSGAGVLDYVAAWYLKAARYIQGTPIVCAFVSTNSITQGEQVSILWRELFSHYHIKIHFAHRTFAWSSEARGKAAVHCIIVGFAAYDTKGKLLYEYDNIKADPHEIAAANITPYLTDGEV
jgi:type II restriction/modification system DNA methylase subunit YeeA